MDHVRVDDLQTARRAIPVAPEQPGAKAIASCGPPVPGVAVRVMDDAGQPLSERHVGEVLIAGPSLFSGYFGDAERTAQALRDGWFYTGDLGYLADGELYICGRLKDLIIVGGQNVYPESIEALAREVLGEQLRHVAAFGVINEELGTEAPVPVCELRGSPGDEEQARLAGHWQRYSRAGIERTHRLFSFAEMGRQCGELAAAVNQGVYPLPTPRSQTADRLPRFARRDHLPRALLPLAMRLRRLFR